MEITRATEYAVRCVLHLALEPTDRVVPRREIARAREIPEQFLGKIAQRLARAGVIRIHQGARGGYELVTPADRVTLLQVVEVGEGPLSLNKCVLYPKSCSRSCVCAAHRVWSDARRQLRDTLARTTFADLAAQERPNNARKSPALRRALREGVRPPSGAAAPLPPPKHRAASSRRRGGAEGRSPARGLSATEVRSARTPKRAREKPVPDGGRVISDNPRRR